MSHYMTAIWSSISHQSQCNLDIWFPVYIFKSSMARVYSGKIPKILSIYDGLQSVIFTSMHNT